MSINRYKEVVHSQVQHRAHSEILAELAKLEDHLSCHLRLLFFVTKVGKHTQSADTQVLQRIQSHEVGRVATALKRHKATGTVRLLGRGLMMFWPAQGLQYLGSCG